MAWSKRTRKVIWWGLMIGMSLPVLWLLWNWLLAVDEGFNWGIFSNLGYHHLTANPIEYTNRFLGDWALRFLLVALAVTPAARLFKTNQIVAFRRMIGLWAFTYVCLHLTSYVVLDQFFAWGEIWKDIVKRNFITLGMISFLLLLPMAVTSTKGWIKRLGSKVWKNIHKAVYVIAPLASVHYFMMAKGNQLDPKIYIGIVAGLLGIRLFWFIADKNKKAAPKAAS